MVVPFTPACARVTVPAGFTQILTTTTPSSSELYDGFTKDFKGEATKTGGIEYNVLSEKLVLLEAGADDMDYALKMFEDGGISILKDGVKAPILTSKMNNAKLIEPFSA